MFDPTSRFTRTVEKYSQYRPSYPKEVLQVLVDECGLASSSIIADIGSGTGILTRLFLDHGNTVYGVEPNQAMRESGEDFLRQYTSFCSINGTAEATTLPDKSVDFIVIGTAFHWFDIDLAQIEFKRILKSPGWVMMVWNVRNTEKSDLQRDYEELIVRYGTDYRDSKAHKFENTAVSDFFNPYPMNIKTFTNSQDFDWEGLQGRLLSTSYSLAPDDLGYDEMLKELRQIFDRYQKNGKVEFLYKTIMYYGQLT